MSTSFLPSFINIHQAVLEERLTMCSHTYRCITYGRTDGFGADFLTDGHIQVNYETCRSNFLHYMHCLIFANFDTSPDNSACRGKMSKLANNGYHRRTSNTSSWIVIHGCCCFLVEFREWNQHKWTCQLHDNHLVWQFGMAFPYNRQWPVTIVLTFWWKILKPRNLQKKKKKTDELKQKCVCVCVGGGGGGVVHAHRQNRPANHVFETLTFFGYGGSRSPGLNETTVR